MQISLVLLAAGASSRMGFVKQNLVLGQKTMLEHILHNCLMSSCAPVTVVLGLNKKEIVPNLKDLPISIIDNPNAEKGMGSSIKMGLIGTYMTHKDTEAMLLMSSDMPLVNTEIIEKLCATLTENQDIDIVAAAYNGTVGIPAVFRRSVFEQILDIKDDQGAKALFKNNKTSFIEIGDAGIDLDTPEDVKAFQEKYPIL